MAIEIEVKAWVDTPESLKQRIDAIARFTGVFDKTDAYWYSASCIAFPASGVRVRKEVMMDGCGDIRNGVQITRITYKTKEVRDNIEVNHEREFTVSDGAAFEELLTTLNLIPIKRKHKTGWAWVYDKDALTIKDGITVELVLLEQLGYFIELEILANNDAPDTVALARQRLLALLDLLGIARNRIESRYYTELLGQ
ncbi:MAG: CYTH domain-containing protein [Treponema sp.]|jgi:adenylate cyclase class 2|nr:CYTH domain-containing protein [Treponema sp.]